MADDVRLLKIERNAVLEIVQKFGLDPGEFSWEITNFHEYSNSGDTLHCNSSKLSHGSSGFYYTFGSYTDEYSPGYRDRVETADVTDHRSSFLDPSDTKWGKRSKALQMWLGALREEIEAPDLWACIGQEKALPYAASSEAADNRPFSEDEQADISRKLDELKGYIFEGQRFDASQADYIEREFSYIREAAKRFGRKDWLRLLLGVLVGQVVNLALSPEKARGLMHLAGTAFQWVLGAVQGLLQ